MSEPNEVADVLRKALDVMRKRGLAKGRWEDVDGHLCSRGAIRAVTGVHEATKAADSALDHVIAENWPDRLGSNRQLRVTPQFNDHPDTTKDDVERAFEKAIARAEEMVV